MPNRTEQLQQIFARYQEDVGIAGPTTLRDVASWALGRNLWQPEPGALIRQLAEQLSRALRDEYYTDPQGRRVRTKHCVRVPVREDGEQSSMSLWDDIRTASVGHMQLSFQQRRQQVVGDCHQLETDVDSFNENGNPNEPIQMSFDFRADLAELRAVPV